MSLKQITRIAWPLSLSILLFGGGFMFWEMVSVNDYIDQCLDDYSPGYIHEQNIRDKVCDDAQMQVIAASPEN